MIKEDSIQKVLETSRIEEVVDEFVHLKKAGVNFKGNCPFHNEKTPSFVVSPTKNIYKCFGCGKGGTSVQFLMEHEKLSFIEAIKWLAQKYNIELEETEQTAEEIAKRDERESLYIINDFTKAYFSEQLFNSETGRTIGLSYFKERGFNEATIKKFGLGYAQRERTDLFNALKEGQYNLEIAEKLGVIKENRDFFNDRVMFSIHNLSGKIIGFGGRTLSKDKKVPKYINSPESEIYNKRKTLYGLYHAKNDIRKQDECILVEGYTDVITLHQSGIENVVAASGTSLTEDQILLIKRYSVNITVVFDGDTAGVKAAMRGMDMILAQDMNVKLVLLPDGEDPDSYLKKVGADAFSNYVANNAKDFIKFKTDLLLEESAHDPIQKSIAVKSIIESISKIPDTLKRSFYIKEYSDILDIDEGVLHQESNAFIKGEQKKNRFKEYRRERYQEPGYEERPPLRKPNDVKTFDSDEYQERYIVNVLVNFAEKPFDEDQKVKEYVFDNLEDVLERFENESYRLIVERLIKDSEAGKDLDENYFLHHPDEKIQKLAVDSITSPYIYSDWSGRGLELQTQNMPDENHKADTKQAVLRLRERKIRKMLAETQDYISQMNTEDANLALYIKAYQKLKSSLTEVHAQLGTVVYQK